MKIIAAFILNLISASVYAEYRVYQYYVQSKVQNLTQAPYEIVTSTLDPKSYLAYHGGKESLEANLLRSWVCLGNTSKKEVCTISEGRELEEKKTP